MIRKLNLQKYKKRKIRVEINETENKCTKIEPTDLKYSSMKFDQMRIINKQFFK